MKIKNTQFPNGKKSPELYTEISEPRSSGLDSKNLFPFPV